MLLDELSTCLWTQRQALETLAYHLEVEMLMAAAGRSRGLARSTSATELALADLLVADARRAMAADELATALGLSPGATVEQLADALPDGSDVLRSHARHLHHLVGEVETLTEQTRRLLARNLAATTDALALLGVTSSYAPNHPGQTATAHTGGGMLFDTTA